MLPHNQSGTFNQKCEHLLAGIKVEGILRQAADVEEVDRRMNEYEQGLCHCIVDI